MSNQKEHAHQAPAVRLDRAALAAIYDTYQPAVYRYIFRRVGDVETARDLTAGVFQRLVQAAGHGQGPAQPRAWLYRAAHNLVVDYYRRRQHRQHLPLHDNLVLAGANPEQLAGQAVMAAQVRAALAGLTPAQQQVISLKFLAGLSNAEVAAVMERPVGAVKALQHRALAALQRQLLPVGEA